MSMKIAAMVGSLRKKSYNRALFHAVAQLAPQDLEFKLHEIYDIPLYNYDIESQGIPLAVTQLGDALSQADGILLVTPEYNYSVPGVFKNTIDWLSRLPKQPFDHKPVGIIGASGGLFGTARSQYHLRQVLIYMNPIIMNRPEVMVSSAYKKFDEDLKLTDADTREHLLKFISSFQAFVQQMSKTAIAT